ncbi:cytochrome P450 [Streptomyces sp. NPDC051554]|uniref:cytochrome P450 n=1 Tax=Streptomyces sp. NPDC051554 TaxID=3365656 RepID=UPI0037A93943
MTDTRSTGKCPVVHFDHATGDGPIHGLVGEFDRMRAQAPVVRSDHGEYGYWVLTKHELILEAFQNPGLFSSRAMVVNNPDPEYLWIPEMLDPPDHTAWRRLLGPYFSPGRVATMEEGVRRRCVELVEGLRDRGECDFVSDFAQQYPTTIFLQLFGLPLEDLDTFLVWENMIMHPGAERKFGKPGETHHDVRMRGMGEVMGYFTGLIAERRTQPRDDLISSALTWQIDGKPVSQEQLLSFCLLMFMAGLDTVTQTLSYSFHHLATHPEDRLRVAAEPEVVPLAIEEFLRAYAIVMPGRLVTEDTEFHGCPFKKGDMVLLPVNSATRDSAVFPDGEKVVIDRSPNPHIGFGSGPHRCLGAHLARRELRVAMEEWHRVIPEYRLADGARVREHGELLGIDTLPLVWDG